MKTGHPSRQERKKDLLQRLSGGLADAGFEVVKIDVNELDNSVFTFKIMIHVVVGYAGYTTQVQARVDDTNEHIADIVVARAKRRFDKKEQP